MSNPSPAAADPNTRRAASHVAVAKLLKRQRRFAQSLVEWNSAIALNDNEMGWKAERAEVLLALGDINSALADATECVLSDNQNPAFALTLAHGLIKARRFDEATLVLSGVLKLDGTNIAVYHALATAFEGSGHLASALQVHENLLIDLPGDSYSHGERLRLLVLLGRLDDAIAAGEEAYKALGGDQHALRLFLATLIAAGRLDRAHELLEAELTKKPDDAYLQHLVKAVAGEQTDRVPPEAVASYFDGQAATYNVLMPTHYNYRAPVLVGMATFTARPRWAPEHPNHQTASLVLDLGSGSGLVGVMLTGVGFETIGVDASKEMTRSAEHMQSYSALMVDDVLKFFGQDRRLYELVTASQLVPYFGDLKALFEAVYLHLLPTGLFVFTFEYPVKDRTEDWKLEPSGHFTHKPEYVMKLLGDIGFNVVSCNDEVLQNNDHGQPVRGFVVAAERPEKKA
jgi:predicted TPR repeat methyltransferase